MFSAPSGLFNLNKPATWILRPGRARPAKYRAKHLADVRQAQTLFCLIAPHGSCERIGDTDRRDRRARRSIMVLRATILGPNRFVLKARGLASTKRARSSRRAASQRLGSRPLPGAGVDHMLAIPHGVRTCNAFCLGRRRGFRPRLAAAPLLRGG